MRSNDMILITCEDALKDKIFEGLVVVLEIENCGPFVLKQC